METLLSIIESITFRDILAIAGILLGIFFFFKSRRSKTPCWTIETTNLIEAGKSRLEELQVLYRSERVENLSVSKIIFWNKGAETIRGEDIADANPLRLRGKGSIRILDASILSTNNDPSRFLISWSPDKKDVYLGFDYVDQDHGVTLQLVHIGTKSEEIELIGSIKGVKSISLRQPTTRSEIKGFTVMGTILLVIVLIGGIRNPAAIDPVDSIMTSLLFAGLLVLGVRARYMNPPWELLEGKTKKGSD